MNGLSACVRFQLSRSELPRIESYAVSKRPDSCSNGGSAVTLGRRSLQIILAASYRSIWLHFLVLDDLRVLPLDHCSFRNAFVTGERREAFGETAQ